MHTTLMTTFQWSTKSATRGFMVWEG
jgi:hypothetical protein